MNHKYLYTIITVTYNSVKFLEETILSVICQDCGSLEYIIIDGGSTDGTIDIIKKYEPHITHWISEPDHGIYDAMNKGLSLANGKWINFMNSGDSFATSSTIRELFTPMPSDTTLCIYGNHIFKENDKSTIIKALPPSSLKKKIAFCHQAVFLKNFGIRFRSDLKICADYAMFREIYEKYGESVFCQRPIVVSVNDAYGISSVKNRQRRQENISIIALYNKKKALYERIKFFFAKLLGRI